MTPDTVTLVQTSFAKVAPIAGVAADLFYDRLFETAPDVRRLFPNDLAEQKKKLMTMLGTAVAGLDRGLRRAVADHDRRHGAAAEGGVTAYDSGVPLPLPEPEQISILHADAELPLTFVRSRRARRVSLRVDNARRRIVLTAPMRMPRNTALNFAHVQGGWIAARLKRLLPPRPFHDGAEVPFFGVPHRIRHRPDARGTVWREANEIHVAGRAEHLPRRLRDWLIAELRRRLMPLVHAKAERLQRPVKRVSLRDSRSRWGSCGPDGGLSFSWRLVFAPPEVLDYLVAHEVAHLVHKNHGPHFWAATRDLCDSPMELPRTWLRANGEALLQYGRS